MSLKVIFPGVRYDQNKPLLKMFIDKIEGEEVYLDYSSFFNSSINEEDTSNAYNFVKETLKNINFLKFNKVIFITKSIGTYLALKYRKEFELINIKYIVLTPLNETIPFLKRDDFIVFGTNDKYLSIENQNYLKREYSNLVVIEKGNHRLEIDGKINEEIFKNILDKGLDYINK